MGHELGYAADDVFLRMVEDLDVWNDFPWGEHMWRELYGAIRNVNLNHQQGHHKALEMNPNFVSAYSLSGFLLSFKIGEYLKNIDLLSLIEDEYHFSSLSDPDSIRVCLLLSLEVIFMGHELGSAVDDVFLRMVEDLDVWNDFPWGEHMWRELYGAIYPNKCEAQSEWFKRSTDFFKMYIPRAPPVEYGGLFGAYLKKLSLARTRREKDGDAESGTDIAKISRKQSKTGKHGHRNRRGHKEPENAIKSQQ
ncbi:hypothetical protein Tco_1070112 [Tanacetum coccineum]|uniref:Phospholipase-like protein n=1 Tax=Tanacetum coccineum TaxID=301880 RepID=A0ABQ5HMC2_9ASTR